MLMRREQNRTDQRARIVEAARRLFARDGLEEVTMAQVAAAAGVARATVFNHFGSKHTLVEAITEDVIAYYDGMLRNALADTVTPTTTLVRALFETMGAGIEEDRRFYRGVFREIAKVRLGLDEGGVGQRAGAAAIELLVKLLARGQQRGELSRAYRAGDRASAFDSRVNADARCSARYARLSSPRCWPRARSFTRSSIAAAPARCPTPPSSSPSRTFAISRNTPR